MYRLLLLFIGLYTACLAALAQTDRDNSNIKLVFEKTYLHTDRDVYAQGDTLWFKAYLVNAQDNKPISSSGNLYVELLAPDSAKILNREIIRLDNGLGNGDISLADSLASGKYRLRAYTNWMRNFGDNFIFEKEITILNTQARSAFPVTKTTEATKIKGKLKKTATATFSPVATATTTATPTLRFYPEGGSLVEGISSLVGVKAEDANGKGFAAKGWVVSSSGDTVSRFSCDSLGIGLLALLPVKGVSYRALVDLNGWVPVQHGKLMFNLPSALSKGLTLQLKQTDSVIHAAINSSDPLTSNSVTLVLKHGGKTQLSKLLQLQNQQTAVKIPTATLPEGISAVTLYNEQGKPECERLVYIHHPDNKNALNIITDKKSYQPKEQATINISAQPNAQLSMAVVDAFAVPVQQESILSYLQLKSEVKGNIENPNCYFDTTNVNRFKQLDLLLMTQGWRDFVWRRMADTAIRISYEAENGIPLPGRIRDENYNKMLPGLNISLYADKAKGTKIFAVRSDSLGRFSFRDLVLYGKQNVKLVALNDKGKTKGAFWIDTLLPMPVQQRSIRAIIPENPKDSAIAVVVKKRIADQEKKIGKVTQLKEVKISDKSKYKNVVLSDGSVYGTWGTNLNQSFTITPKDYELKTLEWYALVHFYGAQPTLRKTGIKFMEAKGSKIIVNGKVLDRFNLINYFEMPIDRFKHIELKRMVAMGPVLVYLLYLELREDYKIDNPGSINAEVEGYYQARTFYKPVPGAKPSLADYRSTIHWEPNIKTDATGKAAVSFYNAALQTDARVIVEGITDKGEPLVSTIKYEVK